MIRCHKKTTLVCLLVFCLTLIYSWALTRHSSPIQYAISDIATRISASCRDRICKHFLTKADYSHFGYCIRTTWKRREYQEPLASKCQFMNGNGRYPVALASHPGSGNTWVRGLLQEVTGLCTGAVYCDVALRQNGFPGEQLRSGVVLVVKTHQTDPRWSGVHYDKDLPLIYYKKVEHIPVFGAAILLVRSPFNAIVAQYNRMLNVDSMDNHVAEGEPKDFGSNEKWNDFVVAQAKHWQDTIFAYVINNHHHPLLVVSYEELKRNKETELKRMVDFLQVPYQLTILKSVAKRDYTQFKRKKREFKRYTKEQEDYVREVVQETIDALEGRQELQFIADYLHTDVP